MPACARRAWGHACVQRPTVLQLRAWRDHGVRRDGEHPVHLAPAVLGSRHRSPAYRVAGDARGHRRHRRLVPAHRSLDLPILPAQEGGAGDPPGRLGGNHVRDQRAYPLRHRPGRSGVHRRHQVRRRCSPVQGRYRTRRGAGNQDHAGDHRGGDGDPDDLAILVPRQDADRQVDARLLGQRGSGPAVRHKPGTGGSDHLGDRRRPRRGGWNAVRLGQELQAVHLSGPAPADLRRRHSRRSGQSPRRHRRWLHSGIFGGAAHLSLQKVPGLSGTGGLAPGRACPVALHRLQVRGVVRHSGRGTAGEADRHLGGKST